MGDLLAVCVILDFRALFTGTPLMAQRVQSCACSKCCRDVIVTLHVRPNASSAWTLRVVFVGDTLDFPSSAGDCFILFSGTLKQTHLLTKQKEDVKFRHTTARSSLQFFQKLCHLRVSKFERRLSRCGGNLYPPPEPPPIKMLYEHAACLCRRYMSG